MNQLDLNGRNAVVTGGASGLGFAIAERLVASGAKVVIWDLNREAAQAAGEKLGCSSVAADVSDLNSVTSAVQKTLGIVPTIDILINNAGISGPNADVNRNNRWRRLPQCMSPRHLRGPRFRTFQVCLRTRHPFCATLNLRQTDL